MPAAPIWDQRPCHGLRDAYNDTVQPMPMCQDCQRWLHGVTTLARILPRASVAGVAVPVLVCRDRLAP